MYRKIDIRFVALSENREKYSLRGWIMKVAPVYLRKDEIKLGRNMEDLPSRTGQEERRSKSEAKIEFLADGGDNYPSY